jgi:DNA primase
MSGRIPKHFIDDLLNRVDIVDLIDRHVPLKKSGANYVARCPFHTEKTPSFSVNRGKQFFHCFGCGASGNAIGFLMDFGHLDFVEAVEDLAHFAGLEVPRESVHQAHSGQQKAAYQDAYKLLEQAAGIYAKRLKTGSDAKKAAEYLNTRGVSQEIIHTFMLGYAPDEWRFLAGQLDPSLLLQAGMLVDKGDKVYDRFRGRVMFPIRDKRGRFIGFGGRVLDDSLPKYLNSPETPIFHKGNEVYGLYELLQKNAKPARILVVEGYMDVIALATHGVDYAVATLGTATSQAHMDLLFRFTSELIFCFDGDNAGRQAAWRAISSVFPTLKDGRQIRIMLLPAEHDPDSLIRTEGEEKFLERIKYSQALSDYFFEHFSKDLKLAEFEHRSSLEAEAKNFLKLLPIGAFRELMFEELARLAKKHIFDHEAILAYEQKVRQHRQKYDRLSLPSYILALLIQNPKLAGALENQKIEWEQYEFDGVDKFKAMLNFILSVKPANFGVLLEHYRNHEDAPIIKKLASYDFLVEEEGLEAEFLDAISRLSAQARETRLGKLLAKEKNQGLDPAEKELLRKLLSH